MLIAQVTLERIFMRWCWFRACVCARHRRPDRSKVFSFEWLLIDWKWKIMVFFSRKFKCNYCVGKWEYSEIWSVDNWRRWAEMCVIHCDSELRPHLKCVAFAIAPIEQPAMRDESRARRLFTLKIYRPHCDSIVLRLWCFACWSTDQSANVWREPAKNNARLMDVWTASWSLSQRLLNDAGRREADSLKIICILNGD